MLLDHRLEFNLAHSGGLALLAVTGRYPVGVDVEHLRPIEMDSIAGRYFAPDEQALLHPLSGESRRTGFFQVWTRKEAYMKATGVGLYMPLETFAVLPCLAGNASRGGRSPALRLRLSKDQAESARWGLLDLEPGVGFVGALAVGGHGWRLTCRETPDLDVALADQGQ